MLSTDDFDYNNIDLIITSVHMVISRDCPPTWKLNSPPRKQCALVYVIDGQAEYSFPNRTERSKANDLVFFDVGETYKTNVISDNNYKFIVIAFDWILTELPQNPPFKTVNRVTHTHRILEQFTHIEELWNKKGFGYKLNAKSNILNLIYDLFKEFVKKDLYSPLSEQINAAKVYIDKNYSSQIRIETLAELCGYSSSHFRKKFFEIYGISPVAYLNQVRVEKAKKLLKSGFYQNEEIAELVGFNSGYYFCRMFKKLTGLTPKQY